MTRRRLGTTAALACTALLLAACSGDDTGDSHPTGNGTGSHTDANKPAIDVLPAAGGKWKGKNGTWQSHTPTGWAPWRDHVPVQAAGQVWYIVKNSRNDLALGSFSATKPGKVHITKLPWKRPDRHEDLNLRLTAVNDRPVAVFDDSKAEEGTYQAITIDPGTRKASKPALEKVTSPDADITATWSRQSPTVLISTTTGTYTQYDPATNTWKTGPKPAHPGSRVLAKVGTKTVEWVGYGSTKPSTLYVGDTKVNLKLHPAAPQDETDFNGTPTADTVTPLAVTDSWAVLGIHTDDGTDPEEPTNQVVVIRPGQSTAKPVPLESDVTLDAEGMRDGDIGALVSTTGTPTAALTDKVSCITVDRTGKVAVSPGDDSHMSLNAFDGKTAYFDVDGTDAGPASASCTVGSSKAMGAPQDPAVPPVLFTKDSAVFHSRIGGDDRGEDEFVTVKR